MRAMLPAFDTLGCNDIAPHPATATKWKYRVVDAQVGVWSDGVEIVVGVSDPLQPAISARSERHNAA